MTVKVTERDDSHMSHEGVAAGIRIWDVHNKTCWSGCSIPRSMLIATRQNWKHRNRNAKRRPAEPAWKLRRLPGPMPEQATSDQLTSSTARCSVSSMIVDGSNRMMRPDSTSANSQPPSSIPSFLTANWTLSG